MQEAIAFGTMTMTLGLMLSLPRLSMGRHIGRGDVAAVGALVLLTTSYREQCVDVRDGGADSMHDTPSRHRRYMRPGTLS